MSGEVLLYSFLLMLLTQIVKRWIQPKFGSIGVHLFVLLIAIVIASVQWYAQYLPQYFLETILSIYALAVGWYEILIKRLLGDVVFPKVVKKPRY